MKNYITPDVLQRRGFTPDGSGAYALHARPIKTCHLMVNLVPLEDGWGIEIHNWQTEGGKLLSPVDQRVFLDRKVKTVRELDRALEVISDRWPE
jgi:hypothetical protein